MALDKTTLADASAPDAATASGTSRSEAAPSGTAHSAAPPVNESAKPAASTQGLATTQTDSEILRQIQEAIDVNSTPGDLVIARLAIMQSKSPEIDDAVAGYKQGMLIDNITREILSTFSNPPWLEAMGVPKDQLQPCHWMLFVPIFRLPSEYIKWIHRDDRQPTDEFPWEWKTLDRNDPKVKEGIWRSIGGTYTGRKPPVTDNTNFFIGPLDMTTKMLKCNPLVATFSRTSANAGRQLSTQIASHKMSGLMPWDRCYYLYTKQEEFDQGKAYVMNIARGPLLKDCADESVRAQVLDFAKTLSAKDTGHLFQVMMINSAFIDDHAGGDDSNTGQQQSADEPDPFKAEGEQTFQ